MPVRIWPRRREGQQTSDLDTQHPDELRGYGNGFDEDDEQLPTDSAPGAIDEGRELNAPDLALVPSGWSPQDRTTTLAPISEGRIVGHSTNVALADLDIDPAHPRACTTASDPEIVRLAENLAFFRQKQPIICTPTRRAPCDLPRYVVIDGVRRVIALQDNDEVDVIATIVQHEDGRPLDRCERHEHWWISAHATDRPSPQESLLGLLRWKQAWQEAKRLDPNYLAFPTQDVLATQTNLGKGTINKYLRILAEPPEIVKYVLAGRLQIEVAFELPRLVPELSARIEVVRQVLDRNEEREADGQRRQTLAEIKALVERDPHRFRSPMGQHSDPPPTPVSAPEQTLTEGYVTVSARSIDDVEAPALPLTAAPLVEQTQSLQDAMQALEDLLMRFGYTDTTQRIAVLAFKVGHDYQRISQSGNRHIQKPVRRVMQRLTHPYVMESLLMLMTGADAV